MHVVIVYLSGGGLSGGARNTLHSLVPELQRCDGVDRLDVFVPPQSMDLPEVQPLGPRTWPQRDRLLGCPALKKQIRSLHPDVVFIPNAATFDTGGIPTVCMVRNMEALLKPFGENPFLVGCKNMLRAQVARRACQKSTRVIAVSGFVRDFLMTRWRLSPEKVGVVYHGVSPAMSEEQTCPPANVDAEGGNFWFSAGSFIPYRGYEDVLRALATRVAAGRDEQLLLAGVPVYSDAYLHEMRALAESLGLRRRVHWLGYADRAEMAWCFQRALGFIMPSRLEACPNLVLEALANGAVSISTTCPPMPEMFGDTALYYSPGDAAGLAERMETLTAWTGEQRQRRQQGARQRAVAFSWSVAAGRTLEQLQLAAGVVV